jgi:hypothetical protein
MAGEKSNQAEFAKVRNAALWRRLDDLKGAICPVRASGAKCFGP